MTNVFPKPILPAAKNGSHHWDNATPGGRIIAAAADAVELTVWKKSLLFNCNGFAVFDSRGNLVYRVDNYAAGSRGEIVLMDAVGEPLLTIRRKRLSLGDRWMIYDGEKSVDPRFTVRRHVNFRNSKALAQVISGIDTTTSSCPSSSRPSFSSSSWLRKNVVYEIEGSYAQRCVSVFDNTRRCVAEIKPKEAACGVALGADVFRLIGIRSYMEPAVAMAIVILLEQMFGSSAFSPSSGRRHHSP